MKIVFAAVGVFAAVVANADSLDNIGNVRLKGPLGERLDRMIEGHVAGTDVDYITAPFLEKTETKFWWQSEFWGKYMHSAVPYAKYSGSPKILATIAGQFYLEFVDKILTMMILYFTIRLIRPVL